MSHFNFGTYQDSFIFENATKFVFRSEKCFVSGEIFGQPFAMRVNNGMASVILPGNDYEKTMDVSHVDRAGITDTCTFAQADWIFRELVSEWSFHPKVLIPVYPFSLPLTEYSDLDFPSVF